MDNNEPPGIVGVNPTDRIMPTIHPVRDDHPNQVEYDAIIVDSLGRLDARPPDWINKDNDRKAIYSEFRALLMSPNNFKKLWICISEHRDIKERGIDFGPEFAKELVLFTDWTFKHQNVQYWLYNTKKMLGPNQFGAAETQKALKYINATVIKNTVSRIIEQFDTRQDISGDGMLDENSVPFVRFEEDNPTPQNQNGPPPLLRSTGPGGPGGFEPQFADFLNRLNALFTHNAEMTENLNLAITQQTQTIQQLIKATQHSSGPLLESQIYDEVTLNLDTSYRDPRFYRTAPFCRFNFIANPGTDERGVLINILAEYKNIIEISLLACEVPNFINASTVVDDHRYLYLYIDEFEGATPNATPDSRIQFAAMRFDLDKTQNQTHILAFTEGCKRTYDINYPIQALDRFTLSLLDEANNLMDFGPDGMEVFSITNGAVTTITTTVNHQLQTGQTVYLAYMGYLVGDDLIINEDICRAEGWQINVTSPTAFTIAYNSALLPAFSTYGFVLPACRQIVYTIRIKYLRPTIMPKNAYV